MKSGCLWMLTGVACVGLVVVPARGDAILQPGDTIYGIDLDIGSLTGNPDAEHAGNVLDGDSGTKYLSYGNNWSGLIVTPGASTVQSIRFTTANDADGRDPAYYVLYGTTDPISSTAHGTGTSETWTQISSGPLSLPSARLDSSAVVSFANAASFTSYKLLFPALRYNDSLMQIADVQFYPEAGGAGVSLLNSSNPYVPVDATGRDGSSRHPNGEPPANLLDGDVNTKYLNFGEVNSGIVVVPQFGPSTVIGLQLWTANDAPERDPSAFELYGMTGMVDPLIMNSTGEGPWALIASGPLDLPVDRYAEGSIVPFVNDQSYDAYRFVVTGVRDAGAANSMQISGFQLYNIPEPSVLGLLVLGGALVAYRRRR